MEIKITAYALLNSKSGWHGGVLYGTRASAEEGLARYTAERGAGYDSIIEFVSGAIYKPAHGPRIGTAADLGCEVLP